METKNTTFWNLINETKINIPIIQRDYAQGRMKETERRDKFLSAILDNLKANQSLHLDFVYGRYDKDEETFFPIDGQQRLTTLFLLHWYFSIKENKTDERAKLYNFTYDTRISSREFCKAIIEKEILISDNFDANKQIKNAPWFRYGWEDDPTISAMLIMIQAIHDKFNGLSDIWDKLISDNQISFEVLDLGSQGFELTDDLYIKMNARGKQLTYFENFKADFIEFINKDYKDKTLPHPYDANKNISYCDYFSFKIEKEWTDLFWAFRGEKTVIDEMFMNYLSVISQLCFFKDNLDKKAEDFKGDFNQFKDVFLKEENLLILFKSLDLFYEIGKTDKEYSSKKLGEFFSNIFMQGTIDEEYNEQVRLFWNGENETVNLFELCINSGLNLDARNKILLFSIIFYKLNVHNGNIKHFIRIIRNLIQATRQRNETTYNTNIRINEFGNYWKLFVQLATDTPYETLRSAKITNNKTKIGNDDLKHEIVKSELVLDTYKDSIFKLEEFRYFEGLLQNLELEKNKAQLANYLIAINEIWNEDSDTLIIKALIASGFGGVYIKDCRMGEMWYFGKKCNKKWINVLTSKIDSNEPNFIVNLLDDYLLKSGNTKERLNAIVSTWLLNNSTDRSWKYYFLNYDDFTSGYNYYAWENDFEIRMLGTEKINPLLAKHINPYVLTVCKKINNNSICDENQCYQQYSGNSPLILKNGIKMTCVKDGWKIDVGTHIVSSAIMTRFEIDEDLLLKDTVEKDRVEIAVEFINSVC